MSNLRFRPHHFLCTVGFEGKGYSEAFVENYQRIATGLRNSPDGDATVIEVVSETTDSICAPCPNRRGDLCETETRIRALDAAHARILGLKAGDRLTWGEAKMRIREKMNLENFESACAPCSWKRAGICERALRALPHAILATVLFAALSLSGSPLAHADPVSEYEVRRNAIRAKIVGKTKAPKAAKALAKASELLDAKKFAAATAAAAPAEKDADFADHASAIVGAASYFEAEAALEKSEWKKAESRAKKSMAAWGRITETYLYSPWLPSAPKEIGKAELTAATAQAASKQTAKASALYEKAFQRLALENALYLISPDHLEQYATLCLKKTTPICMSWIVKFANHYSKNTAESKRLATKFPVVVEAGKPFFANSKVTTGYKQKDADEMAFDQAFPLVVEEQWSDATEALTKFLEEFPRSAHRFRARYWLAFVLEKKSAEKAKPHFEQLVRESPLTVYGLLAMLALKQEPDGRFKGNAPDLVSKDDQQTPIEAARLGRATKLLAAKADKLAALDIRAIRSRDTAPGPYLLWLSSFAATAGSHLTAFSILSDMIARMDESVYTGEGLDLVFPVVEWPIIAKQGADLGVDPVLILSLIKQESAFEKEISSSVGASGYMQLMPFTASDVEPDVERRDLIQAETNIRIGTKYLKKLLDRYKGNVALALSGYNAGPTAADRWVREGRAAGSFMEYVEQIPYKETRDYVGTIFRNYVWYRYRLRGERVTTTENFWPASAPPPAKTLEKTITQGD